MTVASAHLGIFDFARAETRQSNTTKGEETMATTVLEKGSTQSVGPDAIRPFKVQVPEAELTELRKRINNTKWPERETVTDATQGVQLATTRALARYWGTE